MEGVGLKQNLWHGKRVLVTGHTGFKGGWLSIWLELLGASVIGYSLPAPTAQSLFDVARVNEGIVSITGDVRDLPKLLSVFSEQSPELVVHMAAQSLVRRSYAEPVETFSTNVLGTVNILEAARLTSSVKAVLIVTSDKCYENREWIWPYRENNRLGGHDPYSSSKACAEIVSNAYRVSFFQSSKGSLSKAHVATVRAGNVIGGGDWSQDRLVPDCIRSFTTGRELQLRSPDAVRPWQHVLEPLSGYLILAERLLDKDGWSFSEAWNFGPNSGEEATVREVARQLAELWGEGAVVSFERESKLHEAGILRLDSTKAVTRLNWRPQWSLSRAVRETVDWYKAWHSGRDMRAHTQNQISQYAYES